MTATESAIKALDLNAIKAVIKEDLKLTNNYIENYIQSDILVSHTIIKRLIGAAGKRIRPTITLLMARLLGYQGSQHSLLAAIVEILHTATLLHDDVVDNSTLRRGIQAAQMISNNPTAILSGDFLYSRCFQMMIELDSMPILSVLADASNQITQGELQQLTTAGKRVDRETYMSIITAKTAELFMAACECAAILAGQDDTGQAAARTFGRHFGLAYQLIDDCLDYTNHALGKNSGDDLADGKVTMPILLALGEANRQESKLIMSAIQHKDRSQFKAIQALLQQYHCIEQTKAIAQSHQQQAMAALAPWEDSPDHAPMASLLNFVITRSH